MYILTKYHKVIPEGQPPPSRPVVSSRERMSYSLSNILIDIIEPIAANIPDNSDVISTEDMLSKIDRLNTLLTTEKVPNSQHPPPNPQGMDTGGGRRLDSPSKLLEEGRSMVLVGADAEKLYPSLDHQRTADVMYEATMLTPIKWENMDWQEQGKYAAVNLSEEEQARLGIQHLVPT